MAHKGNTEDPMGTGARGMACREAGAPATPQLANALSLLQEKWVLVIVHALLGGPSGFNEMSRAAGRVNSATLAQRLALLEQAGLVCKTIHSTMPPRTSYALTEAGHALQPVLAAIASWSQAYMPTAPAAWTDRPLPPAPPECLGH